MSPIPSFVYQIPWRIIMILFFIMSFSVLVLYSAAGGSVEPWAFNQAIRFIVFMMLFLFLNYVPLRYIERISYPFYILFVFLLILVEIVGTVKGGSQRWIELGFIILQPSELMKIAIILACARFYAHLPPIWSRSFTALWPGLLLIALPAGLILVQPDLGTAVTIIIAAAAMMFLAGLPLWWFSGAFIIGIAVLPIIFSLLHDYQRKRLLTFLDPESDPLGTGYHISQSKIAIGSGGITGKGFLNGSQSHLDYLPEGHTDFVFATMAEEWGLLGGLVLLLAFGLLLRWSTGVALKARTRFGGLTAAGLTLTIFLYVAINLMMVMGLAPVVGIPLPLFSYGGSSMLTVMLCVGIISAVERDNRVAHTGFSDGFSDAFGDSFDGGFGRGSGSGSGSGFGGDFR